MFGAVILIGQIVAPVALAHRLNKRFDPIVARVHTPAKTTTHGIPHVIEHRVTLVMEHRRHLLPAGGHQHRRDIHTPCMRNEKNHLLIIALHLVDDRFPLPVDAGKDFLRIAQAQLGHHHHRLRRRGIHGVDNRFPLVLAFFREAVQQINLRPAARAFRQTPYQTTEFAEERIAKGWRRQRNTGEGKDPQPGAPVARQ